MIRSFLSWKKIGKSSVMPQQIRSRCTLKKRRMKTLSSLTRAGCLAGVMFVQMDSNEMLHISIEMIPWLGERFSDCTEPEVNYWDADYRQINATYTNKQNSHENVCVVFHEWNKKKMKSFFVERASGSKSVQSLRFRHNTHKTPKEIHNDENKSMTFNVRLKLAECAAVAAVVAEYFFFTSWLAWWERGK